MRLEGLRHREGRRSIVGHADLVPELGEEVGDCVGRIAVVVHHEHAVPLRSRTRASRGARRRCPFLLNLLVEVCEGKLDQKLAAFSEAITGRRHGAAMKLHETSDNRQTESQPSLRPVQRLRLLDEALEYAFEHVAGDADAVVAHTEPGPIAGRDRGHSNGRSGPAVLRSIRQKVGNHL